ncbi:MAG: hypothetical protein AAF399_21650, partial [Bacteroidota bacterium]
MARTKLTQAFKDAISDLPDKDKDKLLYRLIAKDSALVEKLTFELIEDGQTMESRREALGDSIQQRLKLEKQQFYSPGYVLLKIRGLSGDINRHVKTTKDHYGEIELNFFLLNETLFQMGDLLKGQPSRKMETLAAYIIKRTLKLFQLLRKQHPDVLLDFAQDMKDLGENIGQHDLLML